MNIFSSVSRTLFPLALAFSLTAIYGQVEAQQSRLPPVITKIDPREGPITGGTHVVIQGRHFNESAEVYFNNNKVTPVVVESSVRLKIITPANFKGPVKVMVLTDNGPSQGFSSFLYTNR